MATVQDGIYLEDFSPTRSQFRVGRREPLKPVIVVHTAESGDDNFGSDGRAEATARFIRSRSTPGSYHLLGDRDSIVQLVRFDNEAFHDRTGSNPWSIAISLAMDAADWPRLPTSARRELVDSAAQMAELAARWFQSRGVGIPEARLLTKAQSDERGASGFISHARRDPTRRSDPGWGFPWNDFFRAYNQRLSDGGVAPSPEGLLRQLQRLVGVADDGIVGPRTRSALNRNWLGFDDGFDPSVADTFVNNPRLVEWVQGRVNGQPGFALTVDGRFGRQTAIALDALLGRGGVVTADSYLLLAQDRPGSRSAPAAP